MEIGHDEMLHASEEEGVWQRTDLVAMDVDLDQLGAVDDHRIDGRQVVVRKDAYLVRGEF